MTYTPPPFEEADALRAEIMEFLQSCGGIYKQYSSKVEEKVINSIASGQYILYRDGEGKIGYWLCYWKVHSNEIQDVVNGEMPTDIYNGSVLFIAEHGNKSGMNSMRKAIRELRSRAKGMNGLFYNHKGQGIRIFPRQKGE